MSVAYTTLFSTSLSTANTPKTVVGTSLITYHFRTSQVTVNAGSGRTQTDYNDLFNQVLTFTTIENVGKTFTNVVPIETRFSAVAAQPTTTAAAARTTQATATTTPSPVTTSASTTIVSPSTTISTVTTSATVVQALSAQAADDSDRGASTVRSGTTAGAQGAADSSSTTTTRARATSTTPASGLVAAGSSSASSGASSPDASLNSDWNSTNKVKTGVIVAGVLLALLFLGCLIGGGWWFGARRRRRRAERESGLNPGWLSQEKFDFDATEMGKGDEKKGAWMYGFGRSSSMASTAWPEKTYATKWKSSIIPIPTPSNSPLPPIQMVPSPTASYHLFPGPPSPTKPLIAATVLPGAGLKRAHSFPRKAVPPLSTRHPYSNVPDLPSTSNRGPSEATPSVASSSNGSSVDDRGMSLRSTIRSSMDSQLQFQQSPTDSVTIFNEIPSPTDTNPAGLFLRFAIEPSTPTSFFNDLPPLPIVTRGHRAGIPSITLTMATGSIYSETTARSSTHEGSEEEHDNSFADIRHGSEQERRVDPDSESIRSSMSSSQLPALFTTAESLAEEDEARESLDSPTTPTASDASQHESHPQHHHFSNRRLPPAVPSRLAFRPSINNFSSPFDDPILPPSPKTVLADPHRSQAPSPPFPYHSDTPSTPLAETPVLVSTSRRVQATDQRPTSLYRDALEKRKTIVSEADSLQDLGSLLGHGTEGVNEKWPRPPGAGGRG